MPRHQRIGVCTTSSKIFESGVTIPEASLLVPSSATWDGAITSAALFAVGASRPTLRAEPSAETVDSEYESEYGIPAMGPGDADGSPSIDRRI